MHTRASPEYFGYVVASDLHPRNPEKVLWRVRIQTEGPHYKRRATIELSHIPAGIAVGMDVRFDLASAGSNGGLIATNVALVVRQPGNSAQGDQMKRIVSLVALVAILALANVASAQIVAPPVDNTDLVVAPAPTPPAPQVAPAPTPEPTARPVTPSPSPAPKTKVQAPPPVQPVATRPGTGIYVVILLLIALVAVAMVVYMMFFRRTRMPVTASVTRKEPPNDPLKRYGSEDRGRQPTPAPAPAPAPLTPAPAPQPTPAPAAPRLVPAPAPAPAPPAQPAVIQPTVRPAASTPVATVRVSQPEPRRNEKDDKNVADLDEILDQHPASPKKDIVSKKPESKDKGKSKAAKVTKRVIKAGRRGTKAIIFFALLTGLAASASAQGKVSKISPDGFYQGLVNQDVTLTGTDLANVTSVTFGNPTITATVGATAATSLTATVSVPATTPVGRYSIKLVNKDGSVVDTTGVLLHVFTRDGATVGSYVEGRVADQLQALRKELHDGLTQANSSGVDRVEGLKKTLAADTDKVRTELNTRLNLQNVRLDKQDARLDSFAEAVKARVAEIAAAKTELGASIGSLNARVGVNEASTKTAADVADDAAGSAELALGLASETAEKTVVVNHSRIPFKRAKKETLSKGSAFAVAVKARLAEIAAAKGK